jgi:hypothetical protein
MITPPLYWLYCLLPKLVGSFGIEELALFFVEEIPVDRIESAP